MRKNSIFGTVLCVLSILVGLPLEAAPKNPDLSCASLTFLNACALNGGFAVCSKGSTNGTADSTAMCCKDSPGGRRVCSDNPNDIARGAVAPRAPNTGLRAPVTAPRSHATAKPSDVQKSTK